MVRPFGAEGEERIVGTINGTGAYGARTLQWFPDGRSLLVIDRVDGPRKRFRRIDIKSGEATLIFDGPWDVWTGALSYDGKDVFYSHQPEVDDLRLVKRRLDTGEEKELYRVQSDGAGFFGLIASPDGASLTFSLNIGIGKGQRALMVLSTEGGAPRELYRVGNEGNWPLVMSWTRDSRTIVVGATTPKGHSLYAIPAAGGSLKPLGLNMEEIQTPAISPDGKRIVFGGRTVRRELWVVRNLLADLAKAR
jgi:Tol biopolymer transport system component